jgi:hypothetical protein
LFGGVTQLLGGLPDVGGIVIDRYHDLSLMPDGSAQGTSDGHHGLAARRQQIRLVSGRRPLVSMRPNVGAERDLIAVAGGSIAPVGDMISPVCILVSPIRLPLAVVGKSVPLICGGVHQPRLTTPPRHPLHRVHRRS